MTGFIERVQDTYTSIYDSRKKLQKWLIAIVIIISVYHLLHAFFNYGYEYFLAKEFVIGLYVFALVLFCRLFHELYGKWFIHATRERLSIYYVKTKMPRKFKTDGYTGVGKDSTMSAIKKHFRDDIIQKISDDMEYIQMICYPYNFDMINNYLDKNHKVFMTNVKSEFFTFFLEMIKANNCFVKKYYSKKLTAEEHIQELYKLNKNPYDPEQLKKIKYKYNDNIKPQHYLALVIKYSILYIRINYMHKFVITNQPMMETPEEPALVFSTKFTNIQEKNAAWPWPIDGNVIIMQTEGDAFYPSTGLGKNKKPMKTGYRNFNAFIRHLLGENTVNIMVGQRSYRTEKSLRELNHAFIGLIEQTKVYGGEKRIFFLKKYLKWVNFWTTKSLRKKSREKQYRRRSRIYEKMTRLENSGYIYTDIKVSRSEFYGEVSEISLKQAFRYDGAIKENYTIKLCFKLVDYYFGYSTHYIEAVAEAKAKASSIKFHEIMEWDTDLKLKQKHIEYMDYAIFDQMMGIDRPALDRGDKITQLHKSGKLAKEKKDGETQEVQQKVQEEKE